jgi:hypothetical protein
MCSALSQLCRNYGFSDLRFFFVPHATFPRDGEKVTSLLPHCLGDADQSHLDCKLPGQLAAGIIGQPTERVEAVFISDMQTQFRSLQSLE